MIGLEEQLSGSIIIIDFTKIYSFFLRKCFHFKKSVLEGFFCAYPTERSLPLDALVISSLHWNTGHKICTKDEIPNGRIDEMIGPQEHLSGSLIIIELTKIYRLFLWRFAHLKEIVLE